MDIDALLKQFYAHGIAVQNNRGETPSDGYLVALAGSTDTTSSRSFGESELISFLALYGPLLHVGANTYLVVCLAMYDVLVNVSARFEDHTEALAAANTAGQRVIYNVAEDVFEGLA